MLYPRGANLPLCLWRGFLCILNQFPRRTARRNILLPEDATISSALEQRKQIFLLRDPILIRLSFHPTGTNFWKTGVTW